MNEGSMTLKDESNEAGRVRNLIRWYISFTEFSYKQHILLQSCKVHDSDLLAQVTMHKPKKSAECRETTLHVYMADVNSCKKVVNIM